MNAVVLPMKYCVLEFLVWLCVTYIVLITRQPQ